MSRAECNFLSEITTMNNNELSTYWIVLKASKVDTILTVPVRFQTIMFKSSILHRLKKVTKSVIHSMIDASDARRK